MNDSGVSYYVTPQKDFFSSYRSHNDVLKMDNTGFFNIMGIGDIYIETNLGSRLVLKDVRHVLDLRYNLLSMGKINEEGFYSFFGGGQCKLTCGSFIVAKRKRCCSLYRMETKVCDREVNTSEDHSLLELWHKRLVMLVRRVFCTSQSGSIYLTSKV